MIVLQPKGRLMTAMMELAFLFLMCGTCACVCNIFQAAKHAKQHFKDVFANE